MKSKAYYNEIDPKAAAMLRQLIKDGVIADGDVDERSITEVKADDLRGYTQCHFFAGIGGWSVALRLAGWPDDRPVWTGSCPCQPFSTAGKQKGKNDERHLWPIWYGLISECNPAAIFGEQVSSAIRHGWLCGVYSDLETQGYSLGSAVLPACSVNAPHKRDRLWFVAISESERRRRGESLGDGGCSQSGGSSEDSSLGNATSERCGETWERIRRSSQRPSGTSALGDTEHDGSASSTISGSDAASVRDSEARKNGTSQSSGAGASRVVPEQPVEHTESHGCRQGDSDTRGSCQGNSTEQGGGSTISSYSKLANSECLGQQGQRQMGEPMHSTPSREGETDQSFYAGAECRGNRGFWSDYEWIICGDGKARRIPEAKSGIQLVAYGLQHSAPLLHAAGNAIVPQVAAKFIQASM